MPLPQRLEAAAKLAVVGAEAEFGGGTGGEDVVPLQALGGEGLAALMEVGAPLGVDGAVEGVAETPVEGGVALVGEMGVAAVAVAPKGWDGQERLVSAALRRNGARHR